MTAPAEREKLVYTVDEVAAKLDVRPGWLDRWLGRHPRDVRDRPLYRVACRKKLLTDNHVALLIEALPCVGRRPSADIIEATKRLPGAMGKQPPHPGFVYFFRCGGCVKIGYSKAWKRRLASLRTANSQPIEVWAVTEGTRQLERDLHKQFAPHKVSGEWFIPSADLVAYIAGLQ